MRTRESRREAAIERMADHLLEEGLGAATLRPLAAAAGTSDRMLLYYFADRDEILAAVLNRVAERMLVQLDQAIPAGRPRPFHVLLEEVGELLASDRIGPFMSLWLELSASAGRGLQPHLAIAGEIADGFLAWVASRLQADQTGAPSALAPLFMVLVQGMHVLSAIDRVGVAKAAVEIADHFEGKE